MEAKKERLLQETITLLSADLYQAIYDSDDCTAWCDAVNDIIGYAKEFEERLNWQAYNDVRDYITELEKFEEEICNRLQIQRQKVMTNEDTFRYKRVPGWTHDMPALIFSLTEYTLYFRDAATGNIETVEESIDAYENREGDFCILEENYDAAVAEVEEHDFCEKENEVFNHFKDISSAYKPAMSSLAATNPMRYKELIEQEYENIIQKR